MRSITKAFPGVLALNDVNFDVREGTVHGIVGENGAGKSTLMKILSGVYSPDAGEILIGGEKVAIRDPIDSQNNGISIIYQEFSLVPTLSVAENIFLGRLSSRTARGIRWKELRGKARALIEELGAAIDVRRRVSLLSVAEMQMVEIAKALSFKARILIMDEPSATLTQSELGRMFAIVKKLRDDGVTVIYISHRLEEIFALCDSVTVLRDGQAIGTMRTEATTKDEIVRLMVGRTIDAEFPVRVDRAGAEAMRVENLVAGKRFGPVSFSVRSGEILGIAGLVGSGRTELMRALFGADPKASGRIFIQGTEVGIRSPYDAIRSGIGLLTENRKTEGVILDYPVTRNVTMANVPGICKGRFFLDKALERKVSEDYCRLLNVKTPSLTQSVAYLSGGNQQKVVLTKWLFANTRIVIMDEPTRGIDVGAKYEIYTLIQGLVKDGKSVILISSELNEVLSLSNRIIVVRNGKFVGEFAAAEASPETVLGAAIG
jgi:ribose transport system ATP-binding protein